MSTTAYLVLLVKNGKLAAAKITSEPAYSMTHSFKQDAGIWATAAEARSGSFQEAHNDLLELVRRVPNLNPLLPLLSKG